MLVLAPSTDAYVATARACVEPAEPTVTTRLPDDTRASRYSSARTLLPPSGVAPRSSRLIQSDGPKSARRSTGVGNWPIETRGTALREGNRRNSGPASCAALGRDTLLWIFIGPDLLVTD